MQTSIMARQCGQDSGGHFLYFSNLRIKKFADAQFLSFTVENIVNNISEVCHQTDDNPPLSQYNQLTVCGEIVSVIMMSNTNVLFVIGKCVRKSLKISECSNCSAKFKMSKAKKLSMAKLQIKDNNGEMHKVTMFHNILSTLFNLKLPRETTEEHLISMDNIKVKINSSNVVTAVNDDYLLSCIALMLCKL